ncbi:fimbria/pilus outer membrane usher protein [Trinickia sp. NRRL B-1857]|uniref:fimbria/pilus outer membrane usher protein n=1 Tax=Trinickia sp. NRRL B-1857 TaxID=3162879 RepID=UPI003D281011
MDTPVARVDLSQDVYLEVVLNGQPTSKIARFRLSKGQLYARAADLEQLGLRVDRLGADAAAEISLDTVAGLRYTYDAARQTIALSVPDALQRPHAIDTRALPEAPPATSSSGLYVDYDLFASSIPGQPIALANEARYFNPSGVLSQSGIAYVSGGDRRYLRYDTSWSQSNAAVPSTVQIGDTITSSLSWSRSIRIGGFQWRSNFSLRPDLVTFPVPALYGSAVVPSSVDVYVNNVKQFSGDVPSGPFIVNNVFGITGAGTATVVTRDALGRTISTSLPLYVDARMLAAGLSSFSFEAGFLRRGYGLESFSYNPHPALSGSARYGLSDALTLESHGEGTRGLLDAGGGALMRMGQSGVLNGALSASTGHFAGVQASLGYQLIRPQFSIEAQTVRAYGNFGDLASSDGALVPSATDQLTLSLPFVRHQSISLSYIGSKVSGAFASRIGAVSYTVNLGNLVSLNLNAYSDFKQRHASGFFIALNFAPSERISTSASGAFANGRVDSTLNAIRTPDYAGGWGWGVQVGRMGGTSFGQTQFQYLGRDGEATAIAQRTGSAANASLDVAGAVVLMDRSIEFARRIDDGFALVSTDGVGGVPVLHDNRVIGVTDRSGHLLVSDLNAYEPNQIGIDSMKLPVDTRIAVTSMNITPQARSGVLARFGMRRYAAASVILLDARGKALPPGSRVHDMESGKDTIVGYDGIAFIDELQPNNRLLVGAGTSRCLVQFAYAPPRDGAIPTIGPLTCASLMEARQ